MADEGGTLPVTVSPREQLPTLRGRQTQAAIDAAARAVVARKGILATTISDIAAEAGKIHRVVLQLLRLQGSDGP